MSDDDDFSAFYLYSHYFRHPLHIPFARNHFFLQLYWLATQIVKQEHGIYHYYPLLSNSFYNYCSPTPCICDVSWFWLSFGFLAPRALQLFDFQIICTNTYLMKVIPETHRIHKMWYHWFFFVFFFLFVLFCFPVSALLITCSQRLLNYIGFPMY